MMQNKSIDILNRGMVLAVLVSLLVVSGCGGREKAVKPARPLKLNSVILSMDESVNERWPVSVELVRVDDATLVEQLLSLGTDSWFGKQGSAFVVANPRAIVNSWEIVPGTRVGPQRVKVRGRLAGVLFCKLRGDEPPPPIRFERDGDVIIHVTDEGCVLEGGRPSREPGILNPKSWKFW